jgi:hypothetical protein
VSYTAIAAALALVDVSPSERLVAFSLASYANRDAIAYPGNPAAAARAGLSRSRYLHARGQLQQRGLVSISSAGGGRGNSTTISLTFAESGPRFEGHVNPELFEAILGYSGASGSARQLLAAMAAIADEDGVLTGVTTQELQDAAGLADSTYRRARTVLLNAGAVILEDEGGGRGVTNRWLIHDPRQTGVVPARPRAQRSAAPPPSARPLMTSVHQADLGVAVSNAGSGRGGKGPDLTGVSVVVNPAQSRTVSTVKGPDLTGVLAVNPGQSRTVSPANTPPETPSKTPPPNARTGRMESWNQGTNNPPTPLEGGTHPEPILVEETCLTPRGRQRRRMVAVDTAQILGHLRSPTDHDRTGWHQIRERLSDAVPEHTFGIWLEPIALAAIDADGALVLLAPKAISSWIPKRFGRLIDRCATDVNRNVRFATELERAALERHQQRPPHPERALPTNQQKEVSG